VPLTIVNPILLNQVVALAESNLDSAPKVMAIDLIVSKVVLPMDSDDTKGDGEVGSGEWESARGEGERGDWRGGDAAM
jgi:hypothetical protein